MVVISVFIYVVLSYTWLADRIFFLVLVMNKIVNTSPGVLLLIFLCLILDTHALVHFNEDNTSAIVPIKRLVKEDNLTTGHQCSVLWSNRKKYAGTLVCSGILSVHDVCHRILVTIFCEY